MALLRDCLPLLLSPPLHDGSLLGHVEALLHKEGFATAPALDIPEDALPAFLEALGCPSHPPPCRALPVLSRRSISTGAPLPLRAAELTACVESLRAALLGATAPHHPAAALCPPLTPRAALRRGCSLQLVAAPPLPPPPVERRSWTLLRWRPLSSPLCCSTRGPRAAS